MKSRSRPSGLLTVLAFATAFLGGTLFGVTLVSPGVDRSSLSLVLAPAMLVMLLLTVLVSWRENRADAASDEQPPEGGDSP